MKISVSYYSYVADKRIMGLMNL